MREPKEEDLILYMAVIRNFKIFVSYTKLHGDFDKLALEALQETPEHCKNYTLSFDDVQFVFLYAPPFTYLLACHATLTKKRALRILTELRNEHLTFSAAVGRGTHQHNARSAPKELALHLRETMGTRVEVTRGVLRPHVDLVVYPEAPGKYLVKHPYEEPPAPQKANGGAAVGQAAEGKGRKSLQEELAELGDDDEEEEEVGSGAVMGGGARPRPGVAQFLPSFSSTPSSSSSSSYTSPSMPAHRVGSSNKGRPGGGGGGGRGGGGGGPATQEFFLSHRMKPASASAQPASWSVQLPTPVRHSSAHAVAPPGQRPAAPSTNYAPPGDRSSAFKSGPRHHTTMLDSMSQEQKRKGGQKSPTGSLLLAANGPSGNASPPVDLQSLLKGAPPHETVDFESDPEDSADGAQPSAAAPEKPIRKPPPTRHEMHSQKYPPRGLSGPHKTQEVARVSPEENLSRLPRTDIFPGGIGAAGAQGRSMGFRSERSTPIPGRISPVAPSGLTWEEEIRRLQVAQGLAPPRHFEGSGPLQADGESPGEVRGERERERRKNGDGTREWGERQRQKEEREGRRRAVLPQGPEASRGKRDSKAQVVDRRNVDSVAPTTVQDPRIQSRAPFGSQHPEQKKQSGCFCF